MGIHELVVETLEGTRMLLGRYAGRPMLIVNTASRCSFTPQLAGLEVLHRDYGPRGLAVLGFPCNQFLGQEPGSAVEIAAFCSARYGVTFQMHAKVEVKGPAAHPLFVHLTEARPGLFGTRAIKWNFTKFLVDARGETVARFAPHVAPRRLARAIEGLVGGQGEGSPIGATGSGIGRSRASSAVPLSR